MDKEANFWLDESVAENVMSWKKGEGGYETPSGFRPRELFRPSVDIAAAWEVVEKVRLDGIYFNLRWMRNPDYAILDFNWLAEFAGFGPSRKGVATAKAQSAQIAICEAALITISL